MNFISIFDSFRAALPRFFSFYYIFFWPNFVLESYFYLFMPVEEWKISYLNKLSLTDVFLNVSLLDSDSELNIQ